MTYSSALFVDGANDLESAQRVKYRALIDATGIKGDKVLEIGCGWGGFAEFAAGEIGANGHALPLAASNLSLPKNASKMQAWKIRLRLSFKIIVMRRGNMITLRQSRCLKLLVRNIGAYR